MFLCHVLSCWTIIRCIYRRWCRKILLIRAFCCLSSSHRMNRCHSLLLYKLFYRRHAFGYCSIRLCRHVPLRMYKLLCLALSVLLLDIMETETYAVLKVSLIFIAVWIGCSCSSSEMSRWWLGLSNILCYFILIFFLLTLLKELENTAFLLLPFFYFSNLKKYLSQNFSFKL